jgi:hypothetical protein
LCEIPEDKRREFECKEQRPGFLLRRYDLLQALLGVLSLKSVEMELIGLENIKINRNLSRKEVAELVFNSINVAYR